MKKTTAKNTTANIGFEKELWDAACVLWGHIPATEYRNILIGLIFMRYVSCAFESCRQKIIAECKDEGMTDEKEIAKELEDRDYYVADNVFYLPEKARWSYIAPHAHSPEIGELLDEAMREIEKEDKNLKGVLPKVYSSPDLDKTVLGNVVDIFTNIDMRAQDSSGDLLGRTYEYCLAQFAKKEGKDGGEFYTPACIVKTLVAILRPYENCTVYDPCCGSGGMFVQSVDFIRAHSQRRADKDFFGKWSPFSVYGQEANSDTWKMAKINMAIRGINANLGPHHANTYTNDLHKTERFDFILANPPFNHHPFPVDKVRDDVRFRSREQGGFGLPPEGNANFAWIEHMIHHLKDGGKIGLVLANGALSSQSGDEGNIRRAIIEADLVEGIVAMPPQLFYSVTIPATLWFITKGKKQKGKTLFIDARKMGEMVDRTHRELSEEDVGKLAGAMLAFQEGTLEDETGFCKVATTEEIAAQDFVLTPGRYVGVEEAAPDAEPFNEKIARLSKELDELFEKSRSLEKEIRRNVTLILH